MIGPVPYVENTLCVLQVNDVGHENDGVTDEGPGSAYHLAHVLDSTICREPFDETHESPVCSDGVGVSISAEFNPDRIAFCQVLDILLYIYICIYVDVVCIRNSRPCMYC
jgi:hypothetical protein